MGIRLALMAGSTLHDLVVNQSSVQFQSWQSPPDGFLKINTDAALFRFEGCGLVVVTCDSQGRVQLAAVK